MAQVMGNTGVSPESKNLGDSWRERYLRVRSFSEQIASPLSAEDCCIQSMEDASPIRWHLAHTTWFFETFLLKSDSTYRVFDRDFEYLFNSYYNSVGEQYPRAQRGMISRPGVEQTRQYRRHVDQAMAERLAAGRSCERELEILEIGLNHEQQHQELMLTDLKHGLSMNPLDPVYVHHPFDRSDGNASTEPRWESFEGGVVQIGNDGTSFCFDNEMPRHRVFLEPFQLSERCITNGQFREFMEDGGYRRPEFWLSQGWATVRDQAWEKPLYWRRDGDRWTHFTLSGRVDIDWKAPACHLSYFEADAYARWAGCRLPTEFEWEHASDVFEATAQDSMTGFRWSDHRLEAGLPLHPTAGQTLSDDMMGGGWEWTSSHYSAYPGYQAAEGALGEYNGKFMCGVFVLRGGSCATPSGHARSTYRNFFAPGSRWQFSSFRLARS